MGEKGGKKMKRTKFKQLAPMNLQMFAEGADGGTDGAEAGAGEGAAQAISFATQAELDSALDKHANKALETAKAKWALESQQAIERAKSEAEKMASLTAEQKAEAIKQKEADTLATREADITRRELRAQSLEILAERELPKELVEVVVLTDAEACTTSINAIEKAFRSAVESGVNKRLASSATDVNTGGKATTISQGAEAAKTRNQATATTATPWDNK